MNKTFEQICRMSQKGLKRYLVSRLRDVYDNVIAGDGFVYAEGTFPVLLVAHMDTVHEKLPDVILYDTGKKKVWSPNGIGGDDRCGVYMVLEVIRKYNCSVLFCEDEESGMVGAKKFTKTDLAKEIMFNYIIEFDRRGKKDAVFYDCDNEDFEKFITKEFYKTAYGSYSDISVLAPYIGCAAVNLSCGYYNAHSTNEYVIIPEMESSIEAACKILERTTDEDKFEYIEAQYSYGGSYSGGNYSGYSSYGYNNSGYYGSESSYYDSDFGYYIIGYVDGHNVTQWFDTFACSEDEAVGKWLTQNPNLCYNNLIDVYCEKCVY